jgi:hypothetical protein
MVAKISSSNNLYGALAYNQNKVCDKHAQVIFISNMIEPKDGKASTAYLVKPRPGGQAF